ncbi:MAG: hypothetical protein LAT57_06090 [Balneolales bacterium]|nr:hypothetical protein [Balneolales bacterium]
MRTRTIFIFNAAKWLLLFFVLVVAPLVVATIGHAEESRGFWIEFGVGLGFVGLAMMDVAEGALRDWGVPVHKVHSERFNII